MATLEKIGRKGIPRLWEPGWGIRNLQEEMNHLFSQFFGEKVPVETSAFFPALDLVDGKEEMIVKAEIPGMKKEEVQITLKQDLLTISGEKKSEKEEKGENKYYLERRFGSFSRTIQLPCEVKQDKVKASFKDGVLEIRLPKCEEAKAREIKVAVE